MKLKAKWTNSKPLNYTDVHITSASLWFENKFGVIHNLGGKQTYIADYKGKLYFFDPLTLETTKTALSLISDKKLSDPSLGENEFIRINDQLYFIGLFWVTNKGEAERQKVLVIANLTSGEIFNHVYQDGYADELCITSINDTFYAVVVGEENIDKWDIEARKQIATYPTEREQFSFIRIFDNILQIYKRGDEGIYINFDIEKGEPVNELSYEYPDEYYYSSSQSVKIDGKWTVITLGGRNYKESIHRNFIFDALTGKKVGELPHDDIQNTAGYFSYIHYNKAGDPMLILADKRNLVYNLNHIDQGFQYFKDPNSRIDPKILKGYINPEFHHLYDKHDYQRGNIIPTYLNDEPVIVEEKTGKIWSLETLQLVDGTKLAPYTKGDGDIHSLAPLTLPNNKPAFISNREAIYDTRRADLWNPFGEEQSLNQVEHIRETVIDGKSVFITASSDNTLSMYETKSGKLLSQSLPTGSPIKICTLATIKGKQTILVGLENNTVEFYDLPDLQKRELIINVDTYMGNTLFVEEFEGRTQLYLCVESNRVCTWDAETGKPIHQPLEIKDNEGEILNGFCDIHIASLRWNGNLVLAVTELGTSLTFLWDLEKGQYIDRFEFNKKLEKYVEVETENYDVVDIHPVRIDGKELLITLTMHRVLAFFDYNSLKLAGKIKSLDPYNELLTELNSDQIRTYTLGKESLMILNANTNLDIYDLSALKKLKRVPFEKGVTAYTISDGHLIVCHGEEITAIQLLE